MSLRQATLSHFRIREILAKDNTSLGEKANSSGNLRLSPEVEFACPDDFSAPFHIVVVIKVAAILEGKGARKKAVLPRAEASIAAEALFNVHALTKDDFRELFKNMEFLDRLAEQVYPMATIRLSSVLSDMGFTSKFPLSLPEVEDDVVLINEIDDTPPVESSSKRQRRIENKAS
jgi:hypothetical protein